MDRQTREVMARLKLAKAEGTYRTRGQERHAVREAAKARRKTREERYLCCSCGQLVPFLLHGECDHCRQESFAFECAGDPAYCHEGRCFCEVCHPHYTRALT